MWFDSRLIVSSGLLCNLIGVIILGFLVHYIPVMGGGANPMERFRHYLGWGLNVVGFALQIFGLWWV
jgi:hypothetical protein